MEYQEKIFWAMLLAGLALGREALDWFVPTTGFVLRATISTYSTIAVLTALGCRCAWQTRSLRASAVAGLIAAVMAALIKTAGTGLMFAIWHDAATRQAIAQSGGLSESFELPWLIVLPATVLAVAGGLIGKTAATLFRPEISRL